MKNLSKIKIYKNTTTKLNITFAFLVNLTRAVTMFPLIRRSIRPYIAFSSLSFFENSAISCATKNRFISTSDGAQSSAEPMNKLERVGGLPTDLVNQQKMKKTSRTLSTLQNHSVPLAARATVSKDESREFMAVFPDVVRDITELANKFNVNEAGNWFTKALQYNVPSGKKNRGLLVVLTYKNLVNAVELTPENIKLAHYLGWCTEMLQSHFIVTDDIMDNSVTRRGQPCWHRLEDVGLMAINDAALINNSLFILLKKNFRQHECYLDLIELFHECTFITHCGQALDMLMSKKNVTSFTMDKYNLVTANKTSFYSFYMPVALAMHLAGIKDPEAFRQAKTILLEMGHFFQVQDDFLDCFGNPDVTGKIGTDIQDNKCSWLAVVCMQRANEKQKDLMASCYGSSEPSKIDQVKELYKSLGIPNTYATYEEESYNMIKTHIQQTSRGVPHQVFLQILNKIYQRDS